MVEDRDREHYSKGILISDLWEEDVARLLLLPESPLEITQIHSQVVNKYGEIKINDQLYRIPNASPSQRVLVKAYWDRLVVLDEHGEKRFHTRPRVCSKGRKH